MGNQPFQKWKREIGNENVRELERTLERMLGRIEGLERELRDLRTREAALLTKLALTDGIAAPGAASGQALVYVDTADGDLKVIFGDGTVKTIVVDTP